MNSFLKTGFLLGLGAAVAGKERLEETVSKLVEKGSVSQAEADTLFDTLLKKGEEKSGEWDGEFKETIKSQLTDLGFVTREEMDTVQAQLVLLQEEIVLLRNSGQKPANSGMENIPPGFTNDIE